MAVGPGTSLYNMVQGNNNNKIAVISISGEELDLAMGG